LSRPASRKPSCCGTARTPGSRENLAVEQHAWWRPGRGSAPGYLEQSRQLTAARAGNPWLAGGSHIVQQQALRDFARAMAAFFAGTHGRPSWRKVGRDEGFRVTGQRGKQWDVRRLNRNWGQVRVPKAGWVRFRWSRDLPAGARSFRVTRDRAGRWHVAFAVIPDPVRGPGTGQAVGVDRVEKINPAYTSQRCSACGHVDGRSRESQARFRCTACGRAGNADVNAARNVAAGHAVRARGGDGASRPVNREPQLLAPLGA
jgi:transposase